jgi:hypothetical protein
LGFLLCLVALTAAAFFQLEGTHPLLTEVLYFLKTGSAVSAVAIGIALIATI